MLIKNTPDIDGDITKADFWTLLTALPAIAVDRPPMAQWIVAALFDKAKTSSERRLATLDSLREIQAMAQRNVWEANNMLDRLLENSPRDQAYRSQIAYPLFDMLPLFAARDDELGRKLLGKLAQIGGIDIADLNGLAGEGLDGKRLAIAVLGAHKKIIFASRKADGDISFVSDDFAMNAHDLLQHSGRPVDITSKPVNEAELRGFAYQVTAKLDQEQPRLSAAAVKRRVRQHQILRLAS